MGRRLAQWVVAHAPLAVLFKPFELFLAVLCVVSGVPTLLGVIPRPGTLSAQLAPWLVFCWSFLLVAGGLAVIWGIVRRNESVERLGVSVLFPTALAYAVAIFATLGATGLIAACIVAAFGLACGIHAAVLTEAERVRQREAQR